MSEQISPVPVTDTQEDVSIVGSFGVGCFHFGFKSGHDGEDGTDYVEEVRSFLNGYPNLDDLEIEFCHSWWGSWTENDDEDEDPNEDITYANGIFPWPSSWKISFTLHLPTILQKNIFKGWREIDNCERFHVSMYYSGGFPVAIIHGIGDIIYNPSSAVFLVRKYLERHAPSSEHLCFNSLGQVLFMQTSL